MSVLAVPRSIARSRENTLWSQSSTVSGGDYSKGPPKDNAPSAARGRGLGGADVGPDPPEDLAVEGPGVPRLQDVVPLVREDQQPRLDPPALERGEGREAVRDRHPEVALAVGDQLRRLP